MRVFIARLSALGDLACCLPVATAIRKTFPDAEIVWAADRRFKGLAESCPDINQVVEWPKKWGEAKALGKSLGEFDVALDLQGLLKSGLAVHSVKAKQKLGYHWQREGAWLFSQPVAPDPTSIHVVDQYVDVARAMGAEADRALWNLVADQESLTKMRGLVDLNHPVVVMNGGAGWATKRWKSSSFAALSDLMHKEGAKTYFIGMEADRPVFEEIRQQCQVPPGDLLGKTSIKDLVALLQLADLHIGGDTGSTHIAAAWGVACLGLYTLTRPERSCPYGQMGGSLTTDEAQVREIAVQLLRRGA